MKVFESRIGNFATDQHENLLVVDAITKKGPEFRLYGKRNNELPEGSKPKPIQLNREWLFKLDFAIAMMQGALVDGATYWVKDGICFYEKNGMFYLQIGEQMEHGFNALQFDKVHELQNIFAFMGNELKITKQKKPKTTIPMN